MLSLSQCSKTTALYLRGRAGKQGAEEQVRLQMKCRRLRKLKQADVNMIKCKNGLGFMQTNAYHWVQ